MNHDSPHILDLCQAFHNGVQWAIVVGSKEGTRGIQPLIDHRHVQAWP